MDPLKWQYAMTDLILKWIYVIIGTCLLSVAPGWESLISVTIGGIAVFLFPARIGKDLLR